MLRFVVLGDVHLWPKFQAGVDVEGDSYYALSQVLEYAELNSLPVVHSGDMLDQGEGGGVSTSMAELALQLRRLTQPFLYIVGNHDYPGAVSGIRGADWLDVLLKGSVGPERVHLGVEPVRVNGAATFAGFDYVNGTEAAEDELAKFGGKRPMPDVLVAHQGMKRLLGFSGAWSVDEASLRGRCRLFVCGHVHTPMFEPAHDGLPAILSPGSIVAQRFDEVLDKSFPVVTIDGDRVDVEFVPIRSRRHIVVADRCFTERAVEALAEDTDQFRTDESLPEFMRRPVLYIRYAPRPEATALIARLAQAGWCVVKVAVDNPDADLGPGAKAVDIGASDGTDEVADIARITALRLEPGTEEYDCAMKIQLTGQVDQVIEEFVNRILGVNQEKNDVGAEGNDKGGGVEGAGAAADAVFDADAGGGGAEAAGAAEAPEQPDDAAGGADAAKPEHGAAG